MADIALCPPTVRLRVRVPIEEPAERRPGSFLTGMMLVVQYGTQHGYAWPYPLDVGGSNMTNEGTADESAVKDSVTARPSRKRPRGHITIFTTWCKGCGICVAFCPQGVFEVNGRGRPVAVYADKCTACDLCAMRCPDMAIAVRRLDADELDELEELAELAGQGALPAGGGL
jgi:2-oxoglutarate ferredoxin oxidoreductase subunit delta